MWSDDAIPCLDQENMQRATYTAMGRDEKLNESEINSRLSKYSRCAPGQRNVDRENRDTGSSQQDIDRSYCGKEIAGMRVHLRIRWRSYAGCKKTEMTPSSDHESWAGRHHLHTNDNGPRAFYGAMKRHCCGTGCLCFDCNSHAGRAVGCCGKCYVVIQKTGKYLGLASTLHITKSRTIMKSLHV